MRNMQVALQDAQQHAIDLLLLGWNEGPDGAEIPPVGMESITGPSILRQEIEFVNTTSLYQFHYENNSTKADPTLNNVLIGLNDIFLIYGVQVRIGTGAAANTRTYKAHGVTDNDNSLYNGTLNMEYESNKPQYNVPMDKFHDETILLDPYAGFEFINPMRIVTGYLGLFVVSIDLPSIAGVVLTDDQFISLTLEGMSSRPR